MNWNFQKTEKNNQNLIEAILVESIQIQLSRNGQYCSIIETVRQFGLNFKISGITIEKDIMNRLNQIELTKKGIIVFGGRPGMGVSRTTLKIANLLAKTENVLFISYQDHKQKLIKIIEEQGESLSPLLTINTDLNFYDYGFCQDISEIINKTTAKTIIIDDLDDMLGQNFDLESHHRNKFLLELNSLSENNNIRIILNVATSKKVEFRGGDMKPRLRDFIWSRNLISLANQVYSINRPEYYGITEDENGISTSGRIEIDLIKDDECKESNFVIMNEQEKILPELLRI